ncbi:hypothetical protein GF406_09150 [candidate division KSB1 bacterium]|nr:hypothetical protein [candidate division KSB1 bacterium]
MRLLFIILSFLGLALTVVPSCFVLVGAIAWKTHTQLMFVGMILWFFTAPLWIKAKRKNAQ